MLYVKIKIVGTVAIFAMIGLNEIHDKALGPINISDPVYVSTTPDFPRFIPTMPTIVHPDTMVKNMIVISPKVARMAEFTPVPRPADTKVLTGLADGDKQLKCLALNIYHEARGEGIEGQMAVANVTVNRVNHKYYPNTVCGVVMQKTCGKKLKYTAAHDGCTAQFTWTWDGEDDTPKEHTAWKQAIMVATKVLAGKIADNVKGAILYHTDKVKPYWAKKMVRLATIDDHIFYK